LGSRMYFLMESSDPMTALFMPGSRTRACPLAIGMVQSNERVAGGACLGACTGRTGRGAKIRAESSRYCCCCANLFCAAACVSSLMTSWRSCFQGISDAFSGLCAGLRGALGMTPGGAPRPLPRAGRPLFGTGPWPLAAPRVSCMKKLPRFGMKAGSAVRFGLLSCCSRF
jgi:hypothetical protein